VLLAVGWLAPMPPAAPKDDEPAKGAPPPSDPAPETPGWMRAARSETHSPAQSETPAAAPTASTSAHASQAAPVAPISAHASQAAPTAPTSVHASQAAPAAPTQPQAPHATSAASHTLDQPHAQHGLFEYAEAQSRRTARGDVHVSTAPGKRPMTDAEIDASNRRTAWTIGIIVVVIVLMASEGSRHALNLLRVIG
jgi:hypothetical protein